MGLAVVLRNLRPGDRTSCFSYVPYEGRAKLKVAGPCCSTLRVHTYWLIVQLESSRRVGEGVSVTLPIRPCGSSTGFRWEPVIGPTTLWLRARVSTRRA